ncbi:hypothetical protein [Soonwooa purpurea]
MVDRIKFYIICYISNDILKSKKKHSFTKDGKEFFVFDYRKISFMSKLINEDLSDNEIYKFSINDSDNENENEFSDYSFKNLFITYSRTIGEKEEKVGRLTIHQNIRKNYINYKGLNVFEDLTYQNFVDIINLYADEFKIPRGIFWKASVTQLELGVNLKFKMHISSIINSISQIKRVPKRFLVDNSALYFKAKKFEIVVYDKLDRASEQKEVFPKASKIKRKKLIKKISQNNSILRFELKIKSVKQFNQRDFKGKIESLEKLKINFQDIADSLFRLATDISFVDVISPEVSRKLVQSQLKSKGKKEFDEYLIYMGLKKFGVIEFINFATPLLSSAIKLSYLKSLEKLYNSYKQNNGYVRITFFNKLRKRLDSLTESAF